jgi:hypothetical protein
MYDKHLCCHNVSAHPKLQFIHTNQVQHARELYSSSETKCSTSSGFFVTFQLVGYLVDGINLVHRERAKSVAQYIQRQVNFIICTEGKAVGVSRRRVGTLLCARSGEVFCFVQRTAQVKAVGLIVPLSRTHYCPADNPLSYGV